jgi:hypothetical protein
MPTRTEPIVSLGVVSEMSLPDEFVRRNVRSTGSPGRIVVVDALTFPASRQDAPDDCAVVVLDANATATIVVPTRLVRIEGSTSLHR